MDNIIDHTKKDKVLSSLAECIRDGRISEDDESLKSYRKVFDELTLSDEELILRGERIVLPASLHDLALEKAHQGGHPGMNGLKRSLRSHFWFPKMDKAVGSQSRRL